MVVRGFLFLALGAHDDAGVWDTLASARCYCDRALFFMGSVYPLLEVLARLGDFSDGLSGGRAALYAYP